MYYYEDKAENPQTRIFTVINGEVQHWGKPSVPSASWETYEERDGMTIIERHEIINGVEVVNRVN